MLKISLDICLYIKFLFFYIYYRQLSRFQRLCGNCVCHYRSRCLNFFNLVGGNHIEKYGRIKLRLEDYLNDIECVDVCRILFCNHFYFCFQCECNGNVCQWYSMSSRCQEVVFQIDINVKKFNLNVYGVLKL